MIERKVEGFRAAWSALPKNVRRLDRHPRHAGLERWPRRIASSARSQPARQRPGTACAFDRSTAVRKDIAVAAVLRARSTRYRYVDLTRFFCGPRVCYPVIGGTLVSRDTYGHLTREYAQSLGPYLLDKVRGALAG